jgi:hypothetical protein
MPSLETWAKGVLITAVSLVVINVAVSIRARDLSRA